MQIKYIHAAGKGQSLFLLPSHYLPLSFLPQPNRHWLQPAKITTSKTNSPHNPYSFRFLLISKTTKNQGIFIKQVAEGSRHLATALRLHPFLIQWAWDARRKASPADTVRLSKAQEACRSLWGLYVLASPHSNAIPSCRSSGASLNHWFTSCLPELHLQILD